MSILRPCYIINLIIPGLFFYFIFVSVSADLNATLPLGVVPELFIGKTPVSNTQKISNERYADITATPIDDAELGRLKEAEEKVLKGI